MDSTVIVALAGFATTAATAGVVPVLLARRTERAASAARLHERQLADQANIREQQMAAYIAASGYVDAIQEQLNNLTSDPDSRSGPRPAAPVVGDITARLRLFADWSLFQDWRRLTSAYGFMTFALGEDGPVNERGDFHATPNDPDVVRTQQALDSFTKHLRAAVGVGEMREVDGH